MEMEKRINSQEQEEDVIDLMEIARRVALVFLRSAVKLRIDRGLCVHYQEPYRS